MTTERAELQLQALKIAHVTITRRLSQGQRKQLEFEYFESKKLGAVKWTTMSFHTEEAVNEFEIRIPFCFRPIFLRNLYGWICVIRAIRDNDVLLVRHMSFDPFVFLSVFIPNRISVHHAKEVPELKHTYGRKGKIAAQLERLTGRVSARTARAVVGVTREISEFERTEYSLKKPAGFYPNGISPSLVDVVADHRETDELHAIFMCGTFSSWHGLDLLVDAVNRTLPGSLPRPLTIHLVGKLSDEQIVLVEAAKRDNSKFEMHGVLEKIEYTQIVEKCDVGFASFGLRRKLLAEAATLKVRELLAMGIPVYADHIDASLSECFPFYRVCESPCLVEICDYCIAMKSVPRSEVRRLALSFISKREQMLSLIDWLKAERLVPETERGMVIQKVS